MVATIAYAVVKAIYLGISFRFKPYNQKVNELGRRKKKAVKEGSYKDLQQVNLEELWLSLYKNAELNRISYFDSLSLKQHEIDSKVYNELSKRLKADDFLLPNVHNVEEKSINYEFLDDLLHRTEDARAKSDYEETFYFPESVLPFPKEYLLFALTYLTEYCDKKKEKNDSLFKHLLEKDIRNLRYFDRLLNLRCVNISAELLSIEEGATQIVAMPA